MKAKMTVYQKGGKLPKKDVPAHLKSDAAKMSSTPSEVKVSQLKSQQGREMKDYKAAGRIGADQSGIFEGMKATNKKLSEMEAKAKKERAAKEKARASYMPKYSKGGMMKYLKGGQVKLDKNKDGKISGADFKMMK
jgi:hypothetical protein